MWILYFRDQSKIKIVSLVFEEMKIIMINTISGATHQSPILIKADLK